MATMHLSDEELIVRLTRGEKVAAFHGDLRVALSAVRDVDVTTDAVTAARGLRSPGLAIPGHTKIGTWRRPGHRAFVSARRGLPAVRVRLAGAAYDELVISTADAQSVAERIRARAVRRPGGAPT